MKLGFVLSGLSTGGGKNAYFTIIEELSKRSDIVVFCFGNRGVKKDHLEKIGVDVVYFDSLNPFAIKKKVKAKKVQRVLVDSFVPSLIFKFLSFFTSCFDVRYRFGAITFNKKKDLIYRFILWRETVVVPAQFLKEYLEGFFIKPKHVCVVLNALDLGVFKPNPTIKKIPNLVVTLSRFIPRKRLGRILEIAQKLPHLDFCIYGSGPLFDSIQKEVSYKMIKNVFLMGETSDSARKLQEASIYFLPSKGEGLSYSIFEALLCECKVIVYSDLGGNNQYLRSSENYYIVEYGDELKYFNLAVSKEYKYEHYKFLNSSSEMAEKYRKFLGCADA